MSPLSPSRYCHDPRDVLRHVYRFLLRSAAAIDCSPVLRVQLVARPRTVWDHHIEQFVELREDTCVPPVADADASIEKDQTKQDGKVASAKAELDMRRSLKMGRRAAEDHLRVLNGGADWYWPRTQDQKLASLVSGHKMRCIAFDFLDGEAVKYLRRTFRASPYTKDNVYVGVAAIEMLVDILPAKEWKKVIQKRIELRTSLNFLSAPPNPEKDSASSSTHHNVLGFEVRGQLTPVNTPLWSLKQDERIHAADFGLQLLVAHPMTTGFHRHCLVMMFLVGSEGCIGYIINKPLLDGNGNLVTVRDAMPEVDHPLFAKYLANNFAFVGGMVDIDRKIFVLHRVPNMRGSHPLGRDLYTTNDFDSLLQAFEEDRARAEDVMVLMGVSGWNYEHLTEDVRRGTWCVAYRDWDYKSPGAVGFRTTADYVFSKNTEYLGDPHQQMVSTWWSTFTSSLLSKNSTGTEVDLKTDVCDKPSASWEKLVSSFGPDHQAIVETNYFN